MVKNSATTGTWVKSIDGDIETRNYVGSVPVKREAMQIVEVDKHLVKGEQDGVTIPGHCWLSLFRCTSSCGKAVLQLLCHASLKHHVSFPLPLPNHFVRVRVPTKAGDIADMEKERNKLGAKLLKQAEGLALAEAKISKLKAKLQECGESKHQD